MKRNKIFVATILGLIFALSILVHSQETIDKRSEIISKLNSRNDALISEAYWLLVNDDMIVKPEYRGDAEIKNAVWNALRFLVPKPVMTKSPESEGNSTADYLLYIVGDVRETRAIPYLIENIHFAGFQLSLARMGDEAVSPVLDMLQSENETKKLYATNVLEAMLEPKPEKIEVDYNDPVKGFSRKTIANSYHGLYEASGAARERIKQALKKQFKEGSLKLKISILAAYKYVADDADDIRLLEDIAQNDTYKVRGLEARYKNKYRFPFREEAQKALDYIKKKKLDAENTKADVHKSTVTQ